MCFKSQKFWGFSALEYPVMPFLALWLSHFAYAIKTRSRCHPSFSRLLRYSTPVPHRHPTGSSSSHALFTERRVDEVLWMQPLPLRWSFSVLASPHRNGRILGRMQSATYRAACVTAPQQHQPPPPSNKMQSTGSCAPVRGRGPASAQDRCAAQHGRLRGAPGTRRRRHPPRHRRPTRPPPTTTGRRK